MKKIILVVFTLFYFLSSQVMQKSGTSGAHFLLISPDAKFVSMGNAYTGYFHKGASSVFYNPATLVYSEKFTGIIGMVNWFADIQYSAGAVSYKIDSYSAIAVHYRFLSTGEIEETTIYEQEGTGRMFSWNDLAIGLSYSKFMTDRFSIGANIYYVKEAVDLYNYSSQSIAFDIGTFFVTGFNTLNLGMTIKNFGPELDFNESFADYNNGELESEPSEFKPYHMPLQFQIGLSYEFLESRSNQKLIVSIDGVHPNDALERLNLGAEFIYLEYFSARVGAYSNHDSANLMAGFGINTTKLISQNLDFNYSVSNYGIIGLVHQFSLGFSL